MGLKCVNYINLFSALFLFSQVPMYYGKAQHIALLIFFSTYVLEFFLVKKWMSFCWKKRHLIFISFILYFLLTIIWAPFEQSPQFLNKIIEIRLPFLALGIIGLFGLNKYYRLKYFAYTAIFTSIVLISYLVFIKIGFSEFFEEKDTFKFARMKYINSHMIFNYYLNISLIFVFYLLNTLKNIWIIFPLKVIIAVSGLMIYSILLISEGRVGFLMANLVVFGMLFYIFWNRNKVLSIIVALLLIVGIAPIIKGHQRINSKALTQEPRLVIWRMGVEEFEVKPIFGYAASTGAFKFMDKLSEHPEFQVFPDDVLTIAIKERLLLGAHPHNQFIMTAIEFGIIGLVIFLFMNIFPLFVMPPDLKIYILFFVTLSIVQLMTDIYFSGLTPITYTMLMVLFFCSQDTELEKRLD